jgi:DNA invertase Pin-like site-specific DNA recombinase
VQETTATLIIAKLDRLARNVAFISKLMEYKVSFLAADNPHANKLMLHMLAAFAEHERDQIRARTKAALAAAKARGVVLGRYGRGVLSKQNQAQATEQARQLAPLLAELRRDGVTFSEMARIMNERCIPTVRGGRWHPATVHRLFHRITNIERSGAR